MVVAALAAAAYVFRRRHKRQTVAAVTTRVTTTMPAHDCTEVTAPATSVVVGGCGARTAAVAAAEATERGQSNTEVAFAQARQELSAETSAAVAEETLPSADEIGVIFKYNDPMPQPHHVHIMCTDVSVHTRTIHAPPLCTCSTLALHMLCTCSAHAMHKGTTSLCLIARNLAPPRTGLCGWLTPSGPPV